MAIEGQRIGRYVLYDAIASGGMASVHFGRMVGANGFARTVVIKRLHAHLVQDIEFAAMFLDEGRLAARIRHPNVVSTIDVASLEGELLLVMEYVRGESLSRLLGGLRVRRETMPLPILSSIILGVLYGLEAAHEARTEQGDPLGIVHRDVSPQNVMVGADGLTRVADFGVAKAASRSHSTRDGKIKGKLAYMAPEQLKRGSVDKRADIYSVGVLLWEALAGQRLFSADDGVAVMHAVLHDPIPPLSTVMPKISPALSNIVAKALDRRRENRFASALEMAEAIETASPPALQRHVGAWLLANASESLAERDRILGRVEASTPSDVSGPPPVPDNLRKLAEQPTALRMSLVDAPSIVTGLSLSGEIVSRRIVRRRWVAVALVLVGACAGGVLLFRHSTPAIPDAAVPTAPSATVAEPRETPSAADSAFAGAPDASIAMDPVGSSLSTVARPSPPRPVPLPASSAHAPGSPRGIPRIKSGKGTASCDPPFIVGSDGIERFKPGCL